MVLKMLIHMPLISRTGSTQSRTAHCHTHAYARRYTQRERERERERGREREREIGKREWVTDGQNLELVLR